MSDENYRLVSNEPERHFATICHHPIVDQVISAADVAGDHGIEPTIISQGSSGSYFVRNVDGVIIGVFKPKDEEPYEPLNPKWGKYFHRLCCPFCFGRPCLISNHGYLSEVGASLIDEAMALNIVPSTRVALLTSTAFNHKSINVIKSKTKIQIAEKFPDIGRRFHRLSVPPKTGSLQLYVSGYESAECCIEYLLNDIISKDNKLYNDFIFEFQKLVTLDYIIRNTDRSNSNWLIKIPSLKKLSTIVEDQSICDIANGTIFDELNNSDYLIKIAAIDNGLAFPFKHPDQMRAYPYHWSWLSIANVPFSDRFCDFILPKLQDSRFVEKMLDTLYLLFKTKDHFKKSVFDKQMEVIRGQITNLCAALRQRKSPAELVEMTPMTLQLVKVGTSVDENIHNRSRSNSSDSFDRKKQIFNYVTKYCKRPFFKNF